MQVSDLDTGYWLHPFDIADPRRQACRDLGLLKDLRFVTLVRLKDQVEELGTFDGAVLAWAQRRRMTERPGYDERHLDIFDGMPAFHC